MRCCGAGALTDWGGKARPSARALARVLPGPSAGREAVSSRIVRTWRLAPIRVADVCVRWTPVPAARVAALRRSVLLRRIGA